MCFSATASFAASGGLAAAGLATWRFATPQQKAVAAIPLLFAVQQAIEGLQWLKVASGPASVVIGYVYLFFAYLLWPVYVPIAVYFADPERRWLTRWFIFVGAAVSSYLLIVLASQPLSITTSPNSLIYDVPVPLKPVAAAFYVIVVCGSLLSSSKPYLRWFGFSTFVLAAATVLFSTSTFTSVWCFAAALLSSLLAFWLWRERGIRVR